MKISPKPAHETVQEQHTFWIKDVPASAQAEHILGPIQRRIARTNQSRITRVSHRNGACNVNLDVRIKADF